MIPHRTPAILPFLYPGLHWRFSPEKPEVYLTFDDGPVPGPTEFVLDTLRQFSVAGTFFCIGDNIERHPDLYRRIHAEGHRSGNHTQHHANGWKLTTAEYIGEVKACDEVMDRQHSDSDSRLFRPPFGRITRNQIHNLSSHYIIMWDVLTQDYHQQLREVDCLRRCVRVVRSGSIVVFHDSYKAERNLRYVLPRFIESCLGMGYSFRKIEL